MQITLGDVPEEFTQRIRHLEPAISDHAKRFARSYFDQFRKSEAQLIRGPDPDYSFEKFLLETKIDAFTEEERDSAHAYLRKFYHQEQDREYHRLLLRELL